MFVLAGVVLGALALSLLEHREARAVAAGTRTGTGSVPVHSR